MSMVNTGPRIQQEKLTVEQMIRMYCRGRHHHQEALCGSCQQLLQYAHTRLNHCRFGEQKSTCGACPIHCYKPAMREEIRTVMRYAGPRMLLRHPADFIRHAIHGMKRKRK